MLESVQISGHENFGVGHILGQVYCSTCGIRDTGPIWRCLVSQPRHVDAPRRSFRETRPLRKFPNYMELLSSIIDFEPSSIEEVVD